MADLTVAPFYSVRKQSMVATFLSAIHTIKHSPRVSMSVEWALGTVTNTAVRLATASATVLPNTPTYANGTAGVGATLTAGSNTTLTVDGSVVALNDRVLVKSQASALQNGIYTCTQAGSGSVPWILTRATDCDEAAEVAADILVAVTAGSTNTGKQFLHHGATIVMGTTDIAWEAGEPVGVFSVLVGNDPNHMLAKTLTISTQPAGTASSTTEIDFLTGFALCQLKYTATTGTGVADVYMAAKGA